MNSGVCVCDGWAGGDGTVDWDWDWDWNWDVDGEELCEGDVEPDGPEEENLESRDEASSDLLEEGGERA